VQTVTRALKTSRFDLLWRWQWPLSL